MAEKNDANYNAASYFYVLQVYLGQDPVFPDRRTADYPIIPYHTLYQYIILCETVVLSFLSRRIQLQKHSSPICTNRANSVAVFVGNPIGYNNAFS